MRTQLFGSAIAAVTLITGLQTAQAQNTITLGAIVPSSGPFAEWGRSNTTTLEMLEKQINDAGGVNGVKLKIVIYDDKAKPAEPPTSCVSSRAMTGACGCRAADQQRLRGHLPGRQSEPDRIDVAGLVEARCRQGQSAMGVP